MNLLKIVLALLIISQTSCGIYSFSGASIPKEIKTIAIEYIPNKAPNSTSSLDRIFNQELRNKLVKDAGLRIVDQDGDYLVKGYISSYVITPQASSTGVFTSTYRLTISTQIEFFDLKTEKKTTWNQSFDNFEVYENDISGQEERLVTNISKNISNSIFNKIFSTW